MGRKILTLLVLWAMTVKVLGCDCGFTFLDLPIAEMGWTQTESQRIEETSDLIFNGTLLAASKQLHDEKYGSRFDMTFKVIKYYKGEEVADTINISTTGSDCAFGAKFNTDCLIIAYKNENGRYDTYGSACSKSISKSDDEKRYNRYIRFLEVMSEKIDGHYVFYQNNSYRSDERGNKTDTVEALRFSIKNKQLHGAWKLTNRHGQVLETGQYKEGHPTKDRRQNVMRVL